MYSVGIDGGGSTVRVAITQEDLTIVGQSQGGTVNPGVIGREAAATLIRQKIREALTNANLLSADISVAGIGVAGATSEYAADWLIEVVKAVLPDSLIVPGSDYEIALVGAHGKREGIIVLSGTGSVAFGIDATGNSWRVGGWGYLIGDEGSGYGLGNRALRAILRSADKRDMQTTLTDVILNALQLNSSKDLIAWLYNPATPRTPDVAKLAPLVLQQASAGDTVAQEIIEWGAAELALHVETIVRVLVMQNPAIAFAGSLLTNPNPLSHALCQRLHLNTIPMPLHPPVIGAALLAILKYRETHAN